MQTYIFDFDGTLADSGQAGILATQAAFKAFKLPVPTVDQINYFMGIPIEVSFEKMAPDHHFSPAEFEQLLVRFRQCYQTFETDNLRLFPGIDTALAALVAAGKQLYVVSSKHSTALQRNLTALHIAQDFTGVLGSDQVAHFKPAPDGVLAVIQPAQLDPDQCVMIGDAIFDLQMGRAAGVHTAAVTWGAHPETELAKEQPDFMLTTAAGLLTI